MYLINGVHRYPFRNLCLICGYFCIKFFVYAVKSDAPVGLYDKLLLQPQLFLEVLYLCKKVDYDLTYTLYSPYLCKIGLHTLLIGCIKVIKVHDLTLDIKIQLSGQESPEILMYEIIKSILSHICVEMPPEQIIFLEFFMLDGCKQCQPYGRTFLCKPIGYCLIVQLIIFRLLILGNVIHKADYEFLAIFIVLKGMDAGIVFLILGKKHEFALVIVTFLIVVLFGGSGNYAEMNRVVICTE